MKLLGRFLVALALAFPFFAGTAQAQAVESTIQVRIPFEFNVGKKSFPAGEYSIVRTSSNWLTLRNSRQEVVAYVLATSAQTQTPLAAPAVDFYLDGGTYRLMRVWQANSHYGSEVFRPQPATALAKAGGGQIRIAAGMHP